MTALTNKQRVQINTALAIVHASGHDASGVTRNAKAYQAQGHSPIMSYEHALTAFSQANPNMAKAIAKTIALVGASSDATIARYDHAVTRYNQTGNDDAIEALAPMMARDSVALAIRNGEITQADLASGGLATALGFAPTSVMLSAAIETPAAAPEAPANPAPAMAQVAPSADLASRSGPQRFGGTSGGWGPTGYSSPKTGQALASWTGVPLASAVAGAQDS